MGIVLGAMTELVGLPSDDVDSILTVARSEISTLFVSMSARHPEGRDADYLYWHTFDHRPEQHRIPSIHASLRLVSTTECRASRLASEPPFDRVDHVMTYFFSDPDGLQAFGALSIALEDAGRKPYLLPAVDRGLYAVRGREAAPRVKIGADVLPWFPATAAFLLLERGAGAPSALLDAPGVAGAWWASGLPVDVPGSRQERVGLQLSLCFLDDDPVTVAEGLRPVLEDRWARSAVRPLLAAPFFVLVPQDPGRHLP